MVELFPLFRRVVEGVLVHEVVREACKSAACVVDQLLICAILLLLFFFRWVERVLVHGQAHVWSSLVDGEVLHLWADLLNSLNARCSSTHDSYTLVLEVDIVLWPLGCVVDLALEVSETREGRAVVLRSKSNVGHEVLASNERFVGALNKPFIRLLVEGCSVNAFVVHTLRALERFSCQSPLPSCDAMRIE